MRQDKICHPRRKIIPFLQKYDGVFSIISVCGEPHFTTNGIRLVDFAIRLRIRSWALVIR